MLREMIEKTIYAVSQDDKKPAHTGELFVIEPGSLTIVALDGYRLAIIQRDVECTRDIRIIIPAKTLQELLKIMGGADDDVKIDANRRYVVFTSNGYKHVLPLNARTSSTRSSVRRSLLPSV